MTYFLQNSDSLLFTLLESALKDCIKEPQDLCFISREGDRVYSQQALLTLHSPLLDEILDGAKDACPEISVDASSASIATLIDLFSNGKAATNNKNDLEKVYILAETLGTKISNLVIKGLTKNFRNNQPNEHKEPNFFSTETQEEVSEAYNNDKKTVKLKNITLTRTSVPIVKLEKIYVDDKIEPSPTKDVIKLNCGACYTLFNSRKSLDKHIKYKCKGREAESSKLLQCYKCGRGFDHKSSLKRHKRIVHKEKLPYKCNDCGNTFSRAERLRFHAKSRHNIELPEVIERTVIEEVSDTINEEFNSMNEIECITCTKTFKTKGYLKQHMEDRCKGKLDDSFNFKIKGLKCDECGREFTLNQSLKRHKLRKLCKGKGGYNPCLKVEGLKCYECGKEFTLNQSLQRHKMRNLCKGKMKREYKCNECEKIFNLKQSLQKHQVMHTGDLPYSCKECGDCFAWTGQLRKHTKSRHNIELSIASKHEDVVRNESLESENCIKIEDDNLSNGGFVNIDHYENYDDQVNEASSDILPGSGELNNAIQDVEETDDYDINEEEAYPAISLFCEEFESIVNEETE